LASSAVAAIIARASFVSPPIALRLVCEAPCMHVSVPKGVKLVAAAFVAATALRNRIRAFRARGSQRIKTSMAAFEEISGLAALRPGKAERESSEKNCLTKPKSTEKFVVKTLALVVHGVKSRESKGVGELKKIRAECEKRGITVTEHLTLHEGHCETLVRELDVTGVDAIAVMGGDGTLREAVSAFQGRPKDEHRVCFAFPCGTGNNFARDLGLKTISDVFGAVDRGTAHPVDCVKVTHPRGVTYSVNCVTWGMARNAAATAEGMRWLGPVRYDLAGFYHIMKGKTNHAKLAASDDINKPAYAKGEHKDYMMMFAQNTRCSGRGFTFTPSAKLDDGKFDLVAVHKRGTFKTVGLFDQVKAGGAHVEDDACCYVQCHSAALAAEDTDDLVGIDGEVHVKTPITIECVAGAFTTLV
jgi:diacylglycerol kinase (ATP)